MTGKPFLDKILIGLNLATLLGGLGIFIYTTKIYKKPLPEDSIEFTGLQDEARKNTEVEPFKIEKLTINLYSQQSRLRFLDLEIFLLPFNNDFKKTLEKFKSVIIDMVIETCSDMSPEDLNSISGKILLESRIKKRINTYLGEQIVREIFFYSFVVQ